MASSLTAYADNIPGGNVSDPAVRAVDIARPAVVRIITTLPAHLKVHFPPTTDVTFPQDSQGSYPLQVSGTGTFITSQGDILTADHVIKPPTDKGLEQNLSTEASSDIANYINKNAPAGTTPITRDQVAQQLTSGQLQSTPTYDTASSTVFLSTDYTGHLTATDLKSLPDGATLPVDKIEKESAPDQQDTAIIHVPMKDTPGILLTDSSKVNAQDALTIIGFPGNADINQQPQDLLTSSINQIYVSSIKTSTSGAPLIQVGGNVEQGDSGGPALDNKGNVVGIVSFGVVNAGGPGATNFLQASNSAQNLMSSLNLDTTQGKFQQLWTQTFNDYSATTPGHWHKAVDGFKQLATGYPLFKGIQIYQSYAQTQAQSETLQPGTTATATPQTTQPHAPANTPARSSLSAMALTIGTVATVILLTLLLLALALKRRSKNLKAKKVTPITPAAGLPPKLSQPLADKRGQSGSNPQPVHAAPLPVQRQSSTASATNQHNTLSLKVWPCGHMNRSTARFCSICGESSPT